MDPAAQVAALEGRDQSRLAHPRAAEDLDADPGEGGGRMFQLILQRSSPVIPLPVNICFTNLLEDLFVDLWKILKLFYSNFVFFF